MDTSEKGLEDIIVAHLRDVNGYNQGSSNDYEKTFAMLPANVEAFLRKMDTVCEGKSNSCFKQSKNY